MSVELDKIKSNDIHYRTHVVRSEKEQLADFCSAMQNNTSLTELMVRQVGKEIQEISSLSAVIQKNQSLTKVSFEGVYIANAGAAVLASALFVNATLTDLDLGNCGLTLMSGLVPALKQNKKLVKLSLKSNAFANAGCDALAEALTYGGSTLTELNLSSCNITNINSLSSSLTTNANLRTLDLSQNEFGDEGGVALGVALRTNKCLRTLKIVSCGLTFTNKLETAGKNYITTFIDMLKANGTLLSLDLSANTLGNVGQKLAAAIKENQALNEVRMVGCSTGEKVIAEIDGYTKRNREQGSQQNSKITDSKILSSAPGASTAQSTTNKAAKATAATVVQLNNEMKIPTKQFLEPVIVDRARVTKIKNATSPN